MLIATATCYQRGGSIVSVVQYFPQKKSNGAVGRKRTEGGFKLFCYDLRQPCDGILKAVISWKNSISDQERLLERYPNRAQILN